MIKTLEFLKIYIQRKFWNLSWSLQTDLLTNLQVIREYNILVHQKKRFREESDVAE